GSLRKASYNTAALKSCVELMPAGMTMTYARLDDLPLFNQDVFDAGLPEPARRFRAEVAAADGILIASPEYNFSLSAALKNAIDWGSRPPSHPFDGKPVAIMGASGGILGTARAQYHLRQMCIFLNMFPVNKPEVMISQAQTRFDATGNLTDEATRGLIEQLLESLKDWTLVLKRGRAK
ncbi:MAG TPA: NADPH-dependent FMN reductase, partial [Stellaceae bacterium]|nr:NADPH-dependent FMN reductase [Stellaceae bacterium]